MTEQHDWLKEDKHWFRHSPYFKSFVIFCTSLAVWFAVTWYLFNIIHISLIDYIIFWLIGVFIMWLIYQINSRIIFNKEMAKIKAKYSNVTIEVEYRK